MPMMPMMPAATQGRRNRQPGVAVAAAVPTVTVSAEIHREGNGVVRRRFLVQQTATVGTIARAIHAAGTERVYISLPNDRILMPRDFGLTIGEAGIRNGDNLLVIIASADGRLPLFDALLPLHDGGEEGGGNGGAPGGLPRFDTLPGEIDSVPDDFTCPITYGIMRDPVTADDNKTYERNAIVDWMKKSMT
jgi:hypothetical protein